MSEITKFIIGSALIAATAVGAVITGHNLERQPDRIEYELRRVAENAAAAGENEIAAILYCTLGSRMQGNIHELSGVVVEFAVKQVNSIEGKKEI